MACAGVPSFLSPRAELCAGVPSAGEPSPAPSCLAFSPASRNRTRFKSRSPWRSLARQGMTGISKARSRREKSIRIPFFSASSQRFTQRTTWGIRREPVSAATPVDWAIKVVSGTAPAAWAAEEVSGTASADWAANAGSVLSFFKSPAACFKRQSPRSRQVASQTKSRQSKSRSKM